MRDALRFKERGPAELVTGEGGAVVSDDDDLAAELRLYRSHGRAEGDYFASVGSGEYLALGTNIRMSDLFSESDARPGLIVVRAGALEDRAIAKPTRDIWTGSAPSRA